jgi:serine/threonine protein kinase
MTDHSGEPSDPSGQSTLLQSDSVHSDSHARLDLRQIGEFTLVKKLGEGAYGQVHLAWQSSLGRHIALKLSPAGVTGRNEGQLLAGLEHDHIVKVYSDFYDEATGTHGLCLQYIPGANLGAVIRHLHSDGRTAACGQDILAAIDAHRSGDVSFDPAALRDRDALAGESFAQSVCRLGARLAEALAFAHRKGILHCDIKPANILMTPYGRPLLADFNVAFDIAHKQASGGVGGTITYMAPEHELALQGLAGGRVDERSDIYSLGIVLHELTTGKRPGRSTRLQELPDLLEGTPRELAVVIRRCLKHNPEDRYQSGDELARALMNAWRLLAAQRKIPQPDRVGALAVAYPIAALTLAGLLPHLAASLANISYNSVEIKLSSAQQNLFMMLVLGYNLVVYPALLGVAAAYFWRLHRLLQVIPQANSETVAEARGTVRRWCFWIVGLGVAGWFPGGVLFPLAIDLAAGPVSRQVYVHFLVSFLLAGLIGVVFSYLATMYVVFRSLLPRLCDPDGCTRSELWAEFGPLTAPFELLLVLACAVPLTGAVLLVVLADDEMTLGFRLLVAALIGLGVAGVGIAERMIRVLRTLSAVWEAAEAD